MRWTMVRMSRKCCSKEWSSLPNFQHPMIPWHAFAGWVGWRFSIRPIMQEGPVALEFCRPLEHLPVWRYLFVLPGWRYFWLRKHWHHWTLETVGVMSSNYPLKIKKFPGSWDMETGFLFPLPTTQPPDNFAWMNEKSSQRNSLFLNFGAY